MNSSSENSKSQKSKLSLIKKVKVDLGLGNLNETSDFRSAEKMQKFVSSVNVDTVGRNTRKGKSIKRALNSKDKSVEKGLKAKSSVKIDKKVTAILKEEVTGVRREETHTADLKTEEELVEACKIDSKNTIKKESVVEEITDVIEIDCEEEECDIKETTDTRGTCQACGSEYGTEEMKSHLQKCLKSRFERGASAGEKQVETGCNTDEDHFFCQICQKNLSRMNSQRRTQHLNRCMDKEDDEKKIKELEKKALEDAKSAVLDCPMCGRPCKTDNARKVHVKKCAQKLNVTTEQMLKLMKNQEEEHQMLIAAGVLPKSALNKLKSKSTSDSVLTKTKKVVKEPRSQYDADLQMAMAISISENKPAEKVISEPKKGRKKKGPGEPAMLVALTDNEKKRRLSQRVSNLLVPQDSEDEMDLTPEFVNSEIQSKYNTQNPEVPKLWYRSHLQSGNKENLDLYYVECLVPPIEVSKVIPGSKVRRMSEIPGRETSFIKPKTPLKTMKSGTLQRSHSEDDSETSEDTMVASTQTAVLLAELAADMSQNITQMSTPELDCSGFCPEQPISLEPNQTRNLLEPLQKCMLSMVNNPTHSDIQINTAGGDTVYGHKAIIYCRCPQLVKEEVNGEISLTNISTDAVISVMKYLYGGQISVTESSLRDVLILTERFNLIELTEICKEMKANLATKSPEKLNLSSNKMTVESLLKQLWSDSEEEDDEVQDPLFDEVQDPVTDEIQDPLIDEVQDPVIDEIQEHLFDEVQDHLFDEVQDQTVEKKVDITSSDTKLFEKKDSQSLNEANENPFVKNDNKLSKRPTKKPNSEIINEKEEAHLHNSKHESVIFENDEFEVYSEANSSVNNTPENMDTSQNNISPAGSLHSLDKNEIYIRDHSSNCNENVKNLDESLTNFEDNAIDMDTEYSPEIPIIKSQNKFTSISSASPSQLDNHTELDIISDCFDDDLPKMESPKKSKLGKKTVSSLVDGTPAETTTDDLPKIESPKKRGNRKDTRKLKPETHPSTDKTENSKPSAGDKRQLKSKNLGDVNSSSFMSKKDHVENELHDIHDEQFNSQENNTMHESFDKDNDSLIVIDEEDKKDIDANINSCHRDMSDSINGGKICEHNENVNESGDYEHNKQESELSQDMNVSGGDLFASPSPVIQNKFSYSGKCNDSFSSTNPSGNDSYQERYVSPAFRKTKRKTLDTNSPSKTSPLSKKFKPDVNDDVSIIEDNFSELSPHGIPLSPEDSKSPKFKFREKKKWKFTSKSNFAKNADMTFSGTVRNGLVNENGGKDEQQLERSNDNILLNDHTEKLVSELSRQNLDKSKHGDYSFQSTPDQSNHGKVSPDENLNDSGFNLTQSQSNLTQSQHILTQSKLKVTNNESDDNCEISLIDEEETGNDRKESNMTVQYDMDVSMVTDQNVWDDFDDCGGADEGLVHCTTPARSELMEKQLDSSSKENDQQETDSKDMGEPSVPDEFENLTFCEEFDYIDLETPSTSKSKQNTYKTPCLSKEQKQKLKQWVEPSPFTPMPNYDDMNTPQIKKKVQSYGVKAVGKKRMVKLLKDIYQQTHQYETDSECEDDTETRGKDTEKQGEDRVKHGDNKVKEGDNRMKSGEDKGKCGDESIVVSDDDLDSEFNNSQESQNSDLMEESYFQSVEEDGEPVKPGEKNLEDKLMTFIQQHPDIQVRILMYEPLELEILKQKITEAQIKCSMEKLKEFLDDKCITFTMKNMRKSPRKKRRGHKDGSPSKSKKSPKKGKNSPAKGRGRGKKDVKS